MDNNEQLAELVRLQKAADERQKSNFNLVSLIFSIILAVGLFWILGHIVAFFTN